MGFKVLMGAGVLLFTLALINVSILDEDMKRKKRYMLNLSNAWVFVVSSLCFHYLTQASSESFEESFKE